MKGIEFYYNEYDTYPELLIPRDPPDWLVDSLRFIGVPAKKLIQRRKSRYHVDTLVVPTVPRHTSLTAPSGDFTRSPQALNWVADRLTDYVNQSDSNEERILITRRDADSRRLDNESEIISLLSEYGFRSVNLSAMSLREQITLFNSIEYVVAPHGAGLTNIIYSTDIKILEIFGNFVSSIYYEIAGGLNHEYYFLQCNDVQSKNGNSIVESRDNVVDQEKIIEIIETHWNL
jgi:capsular polysaccharide biosynthesis protein